MIRPCPGGLKHARGRVPTPRGPISIDWKNETTFVLSLVLPDGMTAQVDLPATDGATGVFVDGVSVAATKTGDRWRVNDEVSGSVSLEVK